MLTESQAWREVARRIESGEWLRVGLCYEAYQLLWLTLDMPTFEAMTDRACYHASVSPDREQALADRYYAFPKGKQEGARILAALWMALEAEEAE